MQSANQQLTGSARGYTDAMQAQGVDAIAKPRLSHQLDQLQKLLTACHQAAVGITGAADRILGPVPQNPSKDGPKPPVNSIEQRFAEAIGSAEILSGELHDVLNRLNGAV